MMLWVKTKTCTMVKKKRSGSLTFTVSRFLFSIAIELMRSRVLYKTSTSSLVLTLTIKDISQSLSCFCKTCCSTICSNGHTIFLMRCSLREHTTVLIATNMYIFAPTVTQQAQHKKHRVEHKMYDIFEALRLSWV
jgi:hypothetical protein